MRNRILATFSGAVILLGAASVAQAASIEAKKVDTVSLDFGSLFTPKQFDRDGSVYGVRARLKGVTGSGSESVIDPHTNLGGTPTPGACPGGGGWCDTAHGIAARADFDGWDFHVTGSGVTIGIVDSGIDLNSPEFTGRILSGGCIVSSVNTCASANNQVGGDLGVNPGNTTHGTHVAGIAAGTNVGIATQAKLLPVKVCSTAGNSCNGVNQGIIYAATHGADVINVSIGGPLLSQSDIDAVGSAVHATPNGVLIMVSAGNSGHKNPTGGYLAGMALTDEVRGHMIVVGAAGCNGDNTGHNCANGGLGGPSSFGQQPGARCEIHGGQKYCMRDYFVMAPGVQIWSSVGNGASAAGAYNYLSGTSMAAPFVTGVAALVKSQNLSMTAEDVLDIIIATADDLGAPGHDPIFGAGMVDVTRATAPLSFGGPGRHAASIPLQGMSINSYVGTSGNALNSIMAGPLTGALMQSSLLKSAVMIDSFGRPFTTDLTKFVDNRALGLTNMLMVDQFTALSPFAATLNGPFGQLRISGLGIDTTTPAMLSGMYLQNDRHDVSVRNLLIDSQITDGVELNLGYKVGSNGGLFNLYDANSSEAFAGLFASAAAVNSPYASLTDGGSFVGTTVRLADDLHASVTQSFLTPERQDFSFNPYSKVTQLMGTPREFDQRAAVATVASVNWDVAKWAGIGFTASQTSERNGMLGGLNTGALNLADATNTTAVGVSARVGFGNGWVTTAAYSEGITQLDLRPNNLITSASDLRSRSYGVAVAKHGLFGDNDSLGVALSRPIQVYSGSANLIAATGDTNGALSYGHETLSLASKTPETDLELGYVTTFMDGALALQTNASYQMNLAGQNGTNALAVVSRAKINF
jgi:subtilisin family serine protease